MAPQLTLMKGPAPRSERLWIALAMTSLPVPVSPCRSTGEVSGATCWTLNMTSFSPKSEPMISVLEIIRSSSLRDRLSSARRSFSSNSSRWMR
jgi:hypothetical protein